jgi:hypothetical protein
VNEIEPDAVESALDGLGASWKKREGGWVIPATARTPCEIAIVTNAGGLRVEGVLLSWDEAGQKELTALAALLKRAESDLPGARFELGQGRAVVAVEASSERTLPAAVACVVLAARLVGREAALLLEKEMADRYLAFFGAHQETAATTPRI